MRGFFDNAVKQHNPLRVLTEFLRREDAKESAGQYEQWRFVGYALEIGYDTVTIITSDPFKLAVGGIPRNSFLVMTPSNLEGLTPHFTLLRVLESAPTPLSREVQQTYFELQKRSMPEIDVFTQSELQWGALKTGILGMFYPNPDQEDAVEFSGDINNYVSAHKYRIYAPDDKLLDLIVNISVPKQNRFQIGSLRLTESRLVLPGQSVYDVPTYVSANDFIGTRTAMFGKTRLGKSNVVKLIAQSIIEKAPNVGQLIFDINGEYANDNPQNISLPTAFPEKCIVYALTPKDTTPSEPLRLNFYEQPNSCLPILGSMLARDGRTSGYVASFASVEIPSLEEIKGITLDSDEARRSHARALRKLLAYWAILYKAGYDVNEKRLREIAPKFQRTNPLDPNFSGELRAKAYEYAHEIVPPDPPTNLSQLQTELETIYSYIQDGGESPKRKGAKAEDDFEPQLLALLKFLNPGSSMSGTNWILPYRIYHSPTAGDFVNAILSALTDGKTVILDLGNADDSMVRYFSDHLSNAVFAYQSKLFSLNQLRQYFQIYFEEAHNLFSYDIDPKSIYNRFAKEGAKYQIGMVYSTQSPTTINRDLLAQTENFFVAHLASQDDVNTLAKVNIAYEGLKGDILRAKTRGYIRMLTQSHRFVVSVQARKFDPAAEIGG